MVAALKFLLKFLRKLFCKLWGFIPRCFNFKSWALILAFLARKFGLWRTWNKGKGTLRRSEQAEQTFPGTGALTGVRLDEGQDQAIACSAIPASARHPIQQDSLTVPAQLASSSKATHPGPANLTERHKRDHPQDYPPLEFDAGMHSNRSCASIQSGASDRLSRIIQSQSHESLHSSLGQPKENLKADQVVDVHVHCRAESSASVVVELENPSTALLPRSELVGSPNVHSSPASKSRTLNLPEESPQITPTAPLILDLNLPDHRRLQMIKSNDIPRYSKQFTVPRERRNYDINPLTTKFPHVPENRDNGVEKGTPEADCTPWKAATHPDGALYFFNEERKLFTDTDMHNPVLKEEIDKFYHYLQKVIHHKGFVIPSNNYDLVLELMVTEEWTEWSYYYACHETRCLFWLDVYDANHMISEVFFVTSPAHVKHRLEGLYWNHWSLFPVVFDGRCLQPAVYDELVGILSHGCMDAMTVKFSTQPYDAETMQKMIKLVRKAKVSKSDAGVVYHTVSVSRLLSFFAHWRFLYVHGQLHARIIRDHTVYSEPKHPRSIFFTLLSLVFFLAPEVHLKEVEQLWTDEVIIETVWKSFMTELLKEWDDLILWSTVMLTANVGFLAIPGVVISNINNPLKSASQLEVFLSPSQIASSISILASIGSTVIGLLLIRHNRSKQKEDPSGAVAYLYQSTHRKFGLEPMAIIFSLPWALLMWAMVMFFIALLLFSFYYSNTSTRIFVSVASAMLSVLTLWVIRRAWESSEGREVWFNSLPPSITRAFRNARVRCHNLFVISRREHSSSPSPDHANSVHSTSDREEGIV